MGNEVFSTADDCLTAEQKQAISDWYNRSMTNPPVIPVIPKQDFTLYMDKKREEERRVLLAGQLIMEQALELFNGAEWDRVLKLRKNCEVRIWNRVNFHWRRAMSKWTTFGINQWKSQNGIPLLLRRK